MYKLAVIAYKWRSTGNPAYLSQLNQTSTHTAIVRQTEDDSSVVGESIYR